MTYKYPLFLNFFPQFMKASSILMKVSFWKNECWNHAEEIPFQPRVIKQQDEEGNEWEEEEEDMRSFKEKFVIPLPQSQEDEPLLFKMEMTYHAIAHYDESVDEVKEEPVPPSNLTDMTDDEKAVGYYKLIYELPRLANQ